MSQYPEHEKLTAIRDQSQAIGEFLDWLTGKGYLLARHVVMEPDRRFEVVDRSRGDRFMGHKWRVGVIGDPFRDYTDDGPFKTEAEAQAAADRLTERERRRMEDSPQLVCDFPNVQDLLAEHFGIDRSALESEKRAMLAALRGGAS